MSPVRIPRPIGNPGIAGSGAEAAGRRSARSEAKLEAAKRVIEDEIRRTGELRGGRIRIRPFLKAAGLNPTYLEKRPDLKRLTKLWIEEIDGLLEGGGESRKPADAPDPGPTPLAKVQTAYTAMTLEYVDQGERLREALERIDALVRQNARLQERLEASGIPLDRDA